MPTRTRRALALVATALFSLVLGVAAPAANAATAPVLATEGTPYRSFGTQPGGIRWAQGFRPTANITVASIALLQSNSPVQAKVAIDILNAGYQVLATGSGQTIPDGAAYGYKFSRLNLDAPVALLANTNYVLRLRGFVENAGFFASRDIYAGGTMFNFDSNQFSYADSDIEFRMYDVPAVVPPPVAPTVTVPADRTVEANTTGGATTSLAVTASDGGTPVTPSCAPSLTGVFPLGTTTVTCTATSAGGTATASFKVTVRDTTAPVLVAHNVTAEATSAGGAAVSYVVTATDIADASPTVACNRASGSVFAIGTTAVTCTATDHAGNTTAPKSLAVIVADTTAPVLATHDIGAEATSASGAAVSYVVTATDVADASPTVACNRASGSTFAIGTATVSCTASDHAGNTSPLSSFRVVVADTTAPVVTATGVTAEATSAAGATVAYAVTATDAADPSPAIACSVPSGSTFAIGTTTVTCTATDHAGNTSAPTTLTVVVADTTAPVVTATGVTAEATSATGATVAYAVTATDAADPSPAIVCSVPSGSTFALGTTTVTCTAPDHAGNTSAPTALHVVVADTTAPVLGALADQAVDATGPSGATVAFSATATDGVDAAVAVACTPASGSTFAVGTTAVTCTATDAAGNTSAAKTFQVTVRGAAEQLQVLGTTVVGVGSGNSLTAKVQEIQSRVAAGDRAGARSALKAFTNQVQAQSGKKISTAQAAALIATAERISALLA
ncbi:MAG: hypothetical protein JWN29_1264 [Acidimicrobiales bacterium]|nr:hypothetical protein [Acidimicrobiales bacterium]